MAFVFDREVNMGKVKMLVISTSPFPTMFSRCFQGLLKLVSVR